MSDPVLAQFDLEKLDPEMLLRDGMDRALLFNDHPKLSRSFEKKLEDNIVGLALEAHYWQHGFRKDQHKYRDVVGNWRPDYFSNGQIELKTIRSPTLWHAQNALKYAGNKDFDFAHIWHCDRSVGLYKVFAIFARADLQHPILTF